MYAIIKTGGKQYRVENGDVIDVELLDSEQGTEVSFPEVLFVSDGSSAKVGVPTVANARVKGEVLEEVAGEKVVALKYRRRKGSRCKRGHRQRYARVKITEVNG